MLSTLCTAACESSANALFFMIMFTAMSFNGINLNEKYGKNSQIYSQNNEKNIYKIPLSVENI